MNGVNYCECGCGGAIGRSFRFKKGHALVHYKALAAASRLGDEHASALIVSRGWTVPPYSITFGVEDEFFGMSVSDATYRLNARGIETVDHGYHDDSLETWRVVSDASVSGEGCELVSPILRPKDGSRVRLAIDTLASAGAQVDASAGLHVHHGTAGFTVPEIADSVAHYALFQPVINRLVSEHRLKERYDGTNYASPLTDWSRLREQILNSSNRGELRNNAYSWGRYKSVNLNALSDHGTLEYRQHQATLTGIKAQRWVELTQLFHFTGKHRTLEHTIERIGGAAIQSLSVKDMLTVLDAPEGMTAYFASRERTLSMGGDADDQASQGSPEEEVWCNYCDESGHEEQSDCYWCERCEDRGHLTQDCERCEGCGEWDSCSCDDESEGE